MYRFRRSVTSALTSPSRLTPPSLPKTTKERSIKVNNRGRGHPSPLPPLLVASNVKKRLSRISIRHHLPGSGLRSSEAGDAAEGVNIGPSGRRLRAPPTARSLSSPSSIRQLTTQGPLLTECPFSHHPHQLPQPTRTAPTHELQPAYSDMHDRIHTLSPLSSPTTSPPHP
ncbi:hypothetical protein K443DRAFT_4296 [Laccaria amethystina LaAM-08-1]|uniref:Uncharacterized protein n=1 Tax=Laccaria amethystina LaAM-08-1 TaxID=1095629 RepID=A0A0C9YAA9_9AGAR|nr:hypothetical protein K443DRAFT_4296 [Laccaria amethystina LaAM-08-1]